MALTLPEPKITTERPITFAEACQHLGVSTRTLRRFVAERRIRHYKVGRALRFYPRDLDAFLQASVREVAQ